MRRNRAGMSECPVACRSNAPGLATSSFARRTELRPLESAPAHLGRRGTDVQYILGRIDLRCNSTFPMCGKVRQPVDNSASHWDVGVFRYLNRGS